MLKVLREGEKTPPIQNPVSRDIILQELWRNKDLLKQNLREYVAGRHAMQQILKEVSQREG